MYSHGIERGYEFCRTLGGRAGDAHSIRGSIGVGGWAACSLAMATHGHWVVR